MENKHGKLDLLENGNPNITCTGINNKGIHKTNMFYKYKK